jgi:hypothetical protein
MGKASRRKLDLRQRQNSREQRLWRRRGAEDAAEVVVRKLAQRERALSLWDEALAADKEYRNQSSDGLISMHSIERAVNLLAEDAYEWAGIPMPLRGESLTIEPSYPFSKVLSGPIATEGTSLHVCRNSDVDESTHHRNTFWSWKYRNRIEVWSQGGKIKWGPQTVKRSTYDMRTMGCSEAWQLESEFRALGTLKTLVSHRAWRQYFLTGMFIETSKRSKIKYVFRKLRPTIAMTTKGDELSILCCLCLHPIGYYENSFAGSLVPTDDVIAHLILMRGDEHLFWKRSNQHPSWTPEAAI